MPTLQQRRNDLYKKLHPATMANVLTTQDFIGQLDGPTLLKVQEKYTKYFNDWLEAELEVLLLTDSKRTFATEAKRKKFRVSPDKTSATHKTVVLQKAKNNTVHVYQNQKVIHTIGLFDWTKVSINFAEMWYNGKLIATF